MIDSSDKPTPTTEHLGQTNFISVKKTLSVAKQSKCVIDRNDVTKCGVYV